jgi:hypothetical protein
MKLRISIDNIYLYQLPENHPMSKWENFERVIESDIIPMKDDDITFKGIPEDLVKDAGGSYFTVIQRNIDYEDNYIWLEVKPYERRIPH